MKYFTPAPSLVEDGEGEGDVAVPAGGLVLEHACGNADHVPGAQFNRKKFSLRFGFNYSSILT